VGELRTIEFFNEPQDQFEAWKLSNRFDFNSYLSLFELTKNGVTIRTTLNGIDNFGRHFLLKSTTNDSISIRNYTMVLSMSRSNQEFRKVMIAQCGLKFNDIDLKVKTQENFVFKAQSSDLPLVIKRYPSKTGFSQYIHSLSINDYVELSGPFVCL